MWRLSKSQIDHELSENANITEIEDRKMEDRFKVYLVDVLFILIFVLILHVRWLLAVVVDLMAPL